MNAKMRGLNMEKVVKVPAEIKAAEILRNAIVDGTIAPGSRITEGELSEQMQLSRATIRGALHQLAGEGLTTLKRYAGWSVVQLSANDVWELYTVRSTMERLGARLVAQTINPQSASAISKALSSLEKQCEVGAWNKIADADFRFHKNIVRLAGNGRLIAQYAIIEPQVRMYIRSLDSLLFETEKIVQQHQQIAGAIISGDTSLAGDVAEAHNLVDGEILARHLASKELKLVRANP
ncbi:GntR family transcriptional regulator [Mesorhizobium sp. M0340]|uniref:GntR family transcriptional regulator n=1 Tax=Mesorhizobium sp. M0340 TaxID=2956939 RepID=UPI003334E018